MIAPIQNWHHYAVSVDPVNQVSRMYIDGQLVKQESGLYPWDGSSTALVIGRDEASKNFLKGAVDDVRVNDSVLTPKDIFLQSHLLGDPAYFWKLNGDLTDTAGNFHFNCLGAPHYRTLYRGSAFLFDRNNSLETTETFGVPDEDFCVSLLTQLDESLFAQDITILDKPQQFRIEGLAASKTLRFSIYTKNGGYESVRYTLGSNENLDSLHQIAGVYSLSENKAYLYFNGKAVASIPLQGGRMKFYLSKLSVGKGMLGSLQELRIYPYYPSYGKIHEDGTLKVMSKLNFESSLLDQTGDLTYGAIGQPIYQEDSQGTSLVFNGAGDAVQSTPFLTPKNAFSVSCLAKSMDANWAVDGALVNKEDSFYLGTVKGSKKIRFTVKMANGTWENVYYVPISEITIWHHYHGVFDANKSLLSLYFDGKLVSQKSISGQAYAVQETALTIAKKGSVFLKVALDDLALFSYANTAPVQPGMTTLASPVGFVAEGMDPSLYKLTFREEFDGNTLDMSKWDYPYDGGIDRDNHMDKENVAILNGVARLNLKLQGGQFNSSYIQTRGLFQQKYGYFEARLKTNQFQGAHSSFWIQSPTWGRIKDDLVFSGAEVDVMEYFGKGRSDGGLAQNIYYNSGADLQSISVRVLQSGSGATVDPSLVPYQGFHTYGVEWSPAGYQFYIDGKKSIFISQGVSLRDEYVVLSFFSSLWERVSIQGDSFSDFVDVDYVRVFQKRN